mmetsp:Transcript_97126/g.279564  ORF Transcript_97126/g.279564 Transcript_97126/m.279564 type:complete len:91 (+) Transcript_97126:1817-2089(+)
MEGNPEQPEVEPMMIGFDGPGLSGDAESMARAGSEAMVAELRAAADDVWAPLFEQGFGASPELVGVVLGTDTVAAGGGASRSATLVVIPG